jgi:hypothetical protein
MFKKDFFKKPFVVFTLSTAAVCLVGYLNVKIYQGRQMKLAKMEAKNATRAIANVTKAYSFGGACSSQGSWTQQALAQTATIRDALVTLRDDPNCKGIEGIVAKLDTAKNAFAPGNGAENHATWESLPGDMKALTSMVGKNSKDVNKDIIPVLMGKTIENTVLAGNIKSLAERSRRSLMTGLDFLDQSLDVLPQMDECLSAHPDQTLALFGASLKLTSAFISSGETAVGRMGTTVAKLVTFMQKKKYSKILRKLNQTEYWMSMSCILETTTEAYCSTKDAYEMLDYSLKENALMRKARDTNENNPLEGYYLLVRELPIITSWLQKVQLGVQPRRSADYNFNAETLDTYNDFKKTQLQLMVTYSEQMDLIASSKSNEEKSNRVFNMVKTLDKMIIGGSARGGQNFFTSGKLDTFVPFYLIGRAAIPDEVSGQGNFANVAPLSTWKYLERGGKYQPEFTAPDALALKIGENLKSLINSSSDSASKYFQDRMVVDAENLVDESLTSQSLTVFKSLENVSNYLGKLIAKSKATRTNLIQLPNMIDTKKRVDDVLGSYRVIKDKVNEYLDMQKDIDSKADRDDLDDMIASDQSLKDAYKVIIDKAYKNFNVLFQNDTYLMTRLSTFVRKDYTQRVSDGAEMTEYQRELMIIAGKNLIDRISAVNQMNPSDVKLDLSSAQVVNKRNLDAVEELFSDQLVGAIAEIKDVAEGRADDKFGIAKGSLYRIFEEKVQRKTGIWERLILPNPIIRWTPTYQILTSDYFRHKERYPLYLFSPNRVKSEEDVYGSFGYFRSRLCIQALAFHNQVPFFPVCDGAKLEPVVTDSAKDKAKLTVHYSQNSVYGRPDYAKNAPIDLIRKGRERNICAYRNFRSKNYAYWMVKNFGDEIQALKQDMSE